MRIEHGGRAWRLSVARLPSGVWIGWPGGARFFPREREEAPDRPDAGSREIRAPMTGTVVRVDVGPGDRVTADRVVLILEAMKMEYRLAAPRAGVVAAVRCRAGDRVELGETLVTLERTDGGEG